MADDPGELERLWRGSGDHADCVAWLTARMRQGELESERVELAAHLGHTAALEAWGSELPPAEDDLRDWVISLERWGIEPSVRATLVAASYIIPEDEPEGSPRLEGKRALETLLACPCDKHEKAARIGWTEDAAWAADVPWSEFAAEAAWEARWKVHSEDEIREAIRRDLLSWALEEPPRPWDGTGTWVDKV